MSLFGSPRRDGKGIRTTKSSIHAKYNHISDKRDNKDEFDNARQTFPNILHDQGYATGLIGKWHLGTTPMGFENNQYLTDSRGQDIKIWSLSIGGTLNVHIILAPMVGKKNNDMRLIMLDTCSSACQVSGKQGAGEEGRGCL